MTTGADKRTNSQLRRLACALSAVAALNTLDLALTLYGLHRGGLLRAAPV